MSEPRVIRADYANWRPVAGRKVLQLVFEVPIEQTADVMTKLGVPVGGESRWCAIALLNEKANGSLAEQVDAAGLNPADESRAGSNPAGAHQSKDRRPFSSLPLSQQAALRCNDNSFQDFCARQCHNGQTYFSAEDARNYVVEWCGVVSRSELDNDGATAERDAWRNLEARYQSWLTDRRYAEARR